MIEIDSLCTKPCADCGDVTKNWACLTCHGIFCGQYVRDHFMQHFLANKDHCVGISSSNILWCCKCEQHIVDGRRAEPSDIQNSENIEKHKDTILPKKRDRKMLQAELQVQREINFCQGFVLPTLEETIKALGSFPGNDVPVEYRIDHSLFPPLPQPQHIDDWLAQYIEKPQSFPKWLDKRNNIITYVSVTILLYNIN